MRVVACARRGRQVRSPGGAGAAAGGRSQNTKVTLSFIAHSLHNSLSMMYCGIAPVFLCRSVSGGMGAAAARRRAGAAAAPSPPALFAACGVQHSVRDDWVMIVRTMPRERLAGAGPPAAYVSHTRPVPPSSHPAAARRASFTGKLQLPIAAPASANNPGGRTCAQQARRAAIHNIGMFRWLIRGRVRGGGAPPGCRTRSEGRCLLALLPY